MHMNEVDHDWVHGINTLHVSEIGDPLAMPVTVFFSSTKCCTMFNRLSSALVAMPGDFKKLTLFNFSV